jgi:hypothetical protein
MKPNTRPVAKAQPKASATGPRVCCTGVPSEAALPRHLKNDSSKDGKENTGSSSYVPREAEKDNQLQYALKMLRGEPLPQPATPPPRPDATAPKGQGKQ